MAVWLRVERFRRRLCDNVGGHTLNGVSQRESLLSSLCGASETLQNSQSGNVSGAWERERITETNRKTRVQGKAITPNRHDYESSVAQKDISWFFKAFPRFSWLLCSTTSMNVQFKKKKSICFGRFSFPGWIQKETKLHWNYSIDWKLCFWRTYLCTSTTTYLLICVAGTVETAPSIWAPYLQSALTLGYFNLSANKIISFNMQWDTASFRSLKHLHVNSLCSRQTLMPL